MLMVVVDQNLALQRYVDACCRAESCITDIICRSSLVVVELTLALQIYVGGCCRAESCITDIF